MARRTPRRLDDYRPGMREQDIEREARMRDRRYSDVADRIVDDYLREDRDEVLRTMVNDVELVVTPEMVEIINDPNIEMTRDMRIQRVSSPRGVRSGLGTGQFSSQFASTGIPLVTKKRTRKKTSTDKKMSRALKQANAKLRNKNGKLKKGKTMRDVMKMAHRLRKK
jgi:hypothetical protein